MRHILVGMVLVFGLAASSVLAQEESTADQPLQNIRWEAGFRFMPSAVSYSLPYAVDPSLMTSPLIRAWMNNDVALEAGGWIHQSRDNWSQSTNRLLTGGAVYKLANRDLVDFHLAARGIHYSSRTISQGYDCPVPPPVEDPAAPEPLNGAFPITVPPPDCGPMYEIESRSVTYAAVTTAGISWSPTPEIGIGLDFGLVIAQMRSENIFPRRPPIPLDEPMPVPPVYPPEEFSSHQMGLVVTVSLIYRF